MNSCIVEEGTSADYIIKNETDFDLKVERYGGWDSNFKESDTLYLKAKQEFIFNYYDDTGGPLPPLFSTDSLMFSYENLLRKTYTRDMSDKNPFNLDYYEGGKINYKNHVTSYEYNFVIVQSDFEMNDYE